MKRDIITIDEEKCTGCGDCIPGCPEGALQIIDGKARLISDLFCDGLGACIGKCPTGAMKIEKRDAEPYNESKVMENVVKGGANVIKAHLKHLEDHGELSFLAEAIDYLKNNKIPVPKFQEDLKMPQCNCPSTHSKAITEMKKARKDKTQKTTNSDFTPQLNNWPIQLGLMNPNSQFLDNANLLIAADCTPFSYPNFHEKFLKDNILIMFCPKMDKTLDNYIEKLTYIFEHKNINSLSIVHMEVPCCSGIEIIVKKALEKANKTMTIKDYTISISGEII